MTRLEDALRETFAGDVDAAAPEMLDEVRRGARRRRTTRHAASVAVAAVVVAGTAIGGSLLGGDSGAPAPAPRPTGDITGEQPDEAPRAEALQVEAVGDLLFATTNEDDCGCSAFWRLDDSGWHRLHDFPEKNVQRLAMGPDGESGWAATPRSGIWVTRDGGETWEEAGIEGLPRGQHSFVLTATGDPRWPAWAVDATGGTIWRLNGDHFEQVSSDDVGAVDAVHSVGDAIVVAERPEDEGDVVAWSKVTRDGGQTWTDLPFPCNVENQLIPGRTAVFALCPAGEWGATIHRSTDLAGWETFGRSQGYVRDQVALGEDAILLRGRRDTLHTSDGSTDADTGLGSEDLTWDAAAVGDTLYLATTIGCLASDDGGVTWEPAR